MEYLAPEEAGMGVSEMEGVHLELYLMLRVTGVIHAHQSKDNPNGHQRVGLASF